jgi:Ca-activated chloride channel family protein
MYNEAISSYLYARNEPLVAPYAEFALGSAYLALDQPDAAELRFQAAEGYFGDNPSLLYRIRYNSGVVKFEKGDFTGAVDDFRSALKADSNARDAKRNLELSLISLYMKDNESRIEETGMGSIAEEMNRNQSEIIFDFVRRKETEKWKSWEWAGAEDDNGPDY